MTVAGDPAVIRAETTQDPALEVTATEGDFGGDVLSLIAGAQYNTTGFNFLTATTSASADALFAVRGDGAAVISGGGLIVEVGGATIEQSGLHVNQAGATIAAGGLNVSQDGLTVEDGGAVIYDSGSNASTLLVQNLDVALPSHLSVLSIVSSAPETGVPYPDSFNLLDVVLDGDSTDPMSVLVVSSEPRTLVRAGGMDIIGGVTVASGGLMVEAAGVTIASGGLNVSGFGSFDTDVQVQGVLTTRGGLISTGVVTGTDVVIDGSVTASSGTLTVNGVASTGAITGTTAQLSGSVTAVGVASTGAITGTTAQLSGSLTAVGVASTGVITGTTVYATSFSNPSDRNLKFNIRGLKHRVSRLFDLDGVSFQYKTKKASVSNHTHFGFIAQDVEHHFPEVVTQSPSGWRSIDYISFIPLIVEGLKLERARVAQQEDKIYSLQRRVGALEEALAERVGALEAAVAGRVGALEYWKSQVQHRGLLL